MQVRYGGRGLCSQLRFADDSMGPLGVDSLTAMATDTSVSFKTHSRELGATVKYEWRKLQLRKN